MINDLADALGTSRSAAIAIALLVSIQVVVQIYALADLVRRRNAAVSSNKWVWALVILLGNLAGAVIYLAVGRRSDIEAVDPIERGREPEADRTRRAADILYGPDDRK